MSGFSSYDAILNAIAAENLQHVEFTKQAPGGLANGAGVLLCQSYWAAGGIPAAGANSTASHSSDTGGIVIADVGPSVRHLLAFTADGATECGLMIFDRLITSAAVDFSSTGTKTLNTSTIPRYASACRGVQAWLEVTTTMATGSLTLSMSSYTSENGASRAGPSLATGFATIAASGMWPMPLQVGDFGVKSVEQFNVTVANTSGRYNLVLLRPLAVVPLVVTAPRLGECDFALQFPTLPRIYDGATLGFLLFANSNTPNQQVCGSIVAAYA